MVWYVGVNRVIHERETGYCKKTGTEFEKKRERVEPVGRGGDTDEQELKFSKSIQEDNHCFPSTMDIPEGTLVSSATFNSPLPPTFLPDWLDGSFDVSQKMEVGRLSKRRKSPISDHTKMQELKDENVALKATIRKVEKKMRQWEAERTDIPPFLQELNQVS